MPCCAFAAFIVGQILLGFDAIKRFVLGRSASLGDIPDNPAAQWRLIDGGGPSRAAAAPPARRWRGRTGMRWIAVAATIEIALAAGAVWGVGVHLSHYHHLNQTSASAHNHLTARNPAATHQVMAANPALRN